MIRALLQSRGIRDFSSLSIRWCRGNMKRDPAHRPFKTWRKNVSLRPSIFFSMFYENPYDPYNITIRLSEFFIFVVYYFLCMRTRKLCCGADRIAPFSNGGKGWIFEPRVILHGQSTRRVEGIDLKWNLVTHIVLSSKFMPIDNVFFSFVVFSSIVILKVCFI